MMLASATYVVQGSTTGVPTSVVAFGGTVGASSGSTATVTPTDPVRKRVYIAPFGTLVEIDAGAIASVQMDLNAQTATFNLVNVVPNVSGAATASAAIVWVTTESLETEERFGVTTTGLTGSRGGSRVIFGSGGTATVSIGRVA